MSHNPQKSDTHAKLEKMGGCLSLKAPSVIWEAPYEHWEAPSVNWKAPLCNLRDTPV